MSKIFSAVVLLAGVTLLALAPSSYAQTQPSARLHLGETEEPSSSFSTPSNATETTVENGLLCTTIDFEGVGNLSAIPEFDGITSPGWLGIIDADAGGSGNFAFEPSPETIAFWLGGPTGTGSSRDIVFTEAAAVVEFFYASFVTIQLRAFDEAGSLVASVTGPPNFNQGPGGDPTGFFNKWDPLRLEVTENQIKRVRVSGAVNQTGIDDLKVCRKIGIDTVEFTQAIQQLQDLEDLEADLQGDGEPPVPLVRGKPAVMRVYFEEVQSVTTLDLEVTIGGGAVQTQTVTLQPGCTRERMREQSNGCASADFYFTPSADNVTVEVVGRDNAGNEVENLTFDLSPRSAEPVVLGAVRICDARTPGGTWRCANNYRARLATLIGLMRKIAPTDRVSVADTGDTVRRDIDADGDGNVTNAEADAWWTATASDVSSMFGLFDGIRDLLGLEDRRYYGIVRPAIPGGTLGIAAGIPSRGAISLTQANDLGQDVSQDTVAHETFHTMGRRHTNTSVPVGGAPSSAPGCGFAADPGTDWPYPDNRLRSGTAAANNLEVGFDVALRQPLLPQNTFDIMSYCVPVWISAFTYERVLDEALDTPFFTSAAAAASVGDFWLVSGRIEAGAALLEPVFALTTAGSTDEGSGGYRLEVVDATGGILFTRLFEPEAAEARVQAGTDQLSGPPAFNELIPVQGGAASLAIRGPAGELLGRLPFAGAEPVVTITFPRGGETLSGLQVVTWEVTDIDSSEHAFWVQYSPDGGALGSWQNLGIALEETSLLVDFDDLPGTASASNLRVVASDGANSGSAVSGPFTVPRKGPHVEILFPTAGEIFRASEPPWLQGFAFDAEDGALDGASLVWESDLDGLLGNGVSVATATLSDGGHTVSLTATDSDGNTTRQEVEVVVAGAGPALELDVEALDTLPTTCVAVTLDALAGSVDLATVEYSLDGGESWIEVPRARLPFRFIVPGEGFFHLVARAFDAAGQLDAADDRFFIESECELQNQPPIADAGADATVECTSPEGAFVTLDGTGSFDPDGDLLAYTWTGAFGVASGPTPVIALPFGTHTITLTVDDGNGGVASDTVTIVIEDTQPPDIESVTAEPFELWPPNHKMVPVQINATAVDVCDPAPSCRIAGVTSNEAEDGRGDGRSAPDISVTGDLSVELRAERAGGGESRIYSVAVECSDSFANASSATTTVVVPHDRRPQ